MPSHRMNSGTQAIEGMARSPCKVGSSSPRRSPITGDRAEQGVRTTTPSPKPAGNTRKRCRDVTRQFAAARQFHDGGKHMVGGGTSRPVE